MYRQFELFLFPKCNPHDLPSSQVIPDWFCALSPCLVLFYRLGRYDKRLLMLRSLIGKHCSLTGGSSLCKFAVFLCLCWFFLDEACENLLVSFYQSWRKS